MTTETLSTEVQQAITKLQGFRDEIRLRLHLGTLEAKQQWDALDPQVAELEKLGHDASDTAKEKLNLLVTKVGELRASFAEK